MREDGRAAQRMFSGQKLKVQQVGWVFTKPSARQLANRCSYPNPNLVTSVRLIFKFQCGSRKEKKKLSLCLISFLKSSDEIHMRRIFSQLLTPSKLYSRHISINTLIKINKCTGIFAFASGSPVKSENISIIRVSFTVTADVMAQWWKKKMHPLIKIQHIFLFWWCFRGVIIWHI